MIFKFFKILNKSLILKLNYKKMSQYIDPCSFSNPSNYLITHASFDWNVDFDKKIIQATCDLTFKKNSNDVKQASIVSTSQLSVA